jgi:hypothetical protein
LGIVILVLFLISKTVLAKLQNIESKKSIIQQRSQSFENSKKNL